MKPLAHSPVRVSMAHTGSPAASPPSVSAVSAAVAAVLTQPVGSAGAGAAADTATPAEPVGRYLGALLPDRTDPQPGSRRLRLWELPHGTLCPVIGVCLPLAVLRRVLTKLLTGVAEADDYTVHVTAIAECDRRSPVAEALQRELDQRHSVALRQAARAKTKEAVLAMWQEALRSGDVAGPLWASLAHPRCDSEGRERICRDVHMMQHQRGASDRADVQQLARLTQEHADRGRELTLLRMRHGATLAERETQLNALTSEVQRLQTDVVGKDAAMASLRNDLAAREGAAGLLKTVGELTHRNQRLQQRVDTLERQLAELARQAHQDRVPHTAIDGAASPLATDAAQGQPPAPGAEVEAVIELRDKAILCVGGRTANVPVYKRLIEVRGGRFVHHDGGEKQTSTQLDASLAAADLVICQTGCVSHEAYWRVKDHCKRTGKRCVFVDNPSVSSLMRSLRAVSVV